MAAKHNANNERIKRQYMVLLREAEQQSEASVDAVAKALARFEQHTRFRDFNKFHHDQAIAYKKRLSEQTSAKTGAKLSKSTIYSELRCLLKFFKWLAMQPSHRPRFISGDASYFNMSANDARVATAVRERPVPSLEQIHHVLANMPVQTEIELRNRAVIAFTILTGARDGAVASIKMKHVDIDRCLVDQDAREVRTKNGKTFVTAFFPVGGPALQILSDWITHLRSERLWGPSDPLFPSTDVVQDNNRQFKTVGLKREHWNTATPIRTIFKSAFKSCGLPYFNPHSFRKTLVQLGERLCNSPEEFKAWSQNIGHQGVLTTFTSYGTVSRHRQAELIQSLGARDTRLDDMKSTLLSLAAKL